MEKWFYGIKLHRRRSNVVALTALLTVSLIMTLVSAALAADAFVSLQSSPPQVEGKDGDKKRVTIAAIDAKGIPTDVTNDPKTKYFSENESVAIVNRGMILLKNSGDEDVVTAIKVTYPGIPQALTIPVTVKGKNPPKVEYIRISPAAAKVAPYETIQMEAEAFFADGSSKNVTELAKWYSDDLDVAIVDRGEVEVVTEQLGIEVKITAEYATKSDTATVTVGRGGVWPTELYTNLKNVKLFLDERYNKTTIEAKLFAKYAEGEDQDVTSEAEWRSSNEEVVYVDGEGVLTAVGVGTAKISATYIYDPETGKGIDLNPFLVTVSSAPKIKLLTVDKKKVQVNVGKKDTLTLTVTYSDGTKEDITSIANWSSKRPEIASVEVNATGKGEVTGRSVGITTVTAAFGDKRAQAVTVKVVK